MPFLASFDDAFLLRLAPAAVRSEVVEAIERSQRLHTKATLRDRRRTTAFWAQVTQYSARTAIAC